MNGFIYKVAYVPHKLNGYVYQLPCTVQIFNTGQSRAEKKSTFLCFFRNQPFQLLWKSLQLNSLKARAMQGHFLTCPSWKLITSNRRQSNWEIKEGK